MTAKYICQNRFDKGEVCGRGSREPEGCCFHREKRLGPLCKRPGCTKRTKSEYGFCNLHVNKCHSKAYYDRKKLDKILQNGQTSEAMREALDKMRIPDTIECWP
jgi:hypothetical protein